MDMIQVELGDCINLSVSWNDSNGNPIDITGHTVSILNAFPQALENMQATVEDAPTGKIKLFLSTTHSSRLNKGDSNFFRIGVTSPTGCLDATPKITINTQ